MNGYEHIRADCDDRGVITVALDLAERSVNVITEPMLGELNAVLDEINGLAAARMLVLRSAKPKGFAAGADLAQVRALASCDDADRFLAAGRTLGARLESLPIPTLALIHGTCVGGGLELAMYCQTRIAQDDDATRLGLPETRLGLIPGWGGTQLLPALVGLHEGARMIVGAELVSARDAERLGLIHRAIAATSIENETQRWIDQTLAGPHLLESRRPPRNRIGPGFRQRWTIYQARWKHSFAQRQNPSLDAALNAISAGASDGREQGLRAERDEFCRILFDPRSRKLLEAFFDKHP